MRKIINKPIIYFACCFVISCQSKENKKELANTNEQILNEVLEIKAVGKVQPEEEVALIASSTNAIIVGIFIKEGDLVQKNQLIIQLDNGNSNLEIQEATAKLNSFREESQTILEDIKKADIYANELRQKYETSKALYTKNAETKENLEKDYSSWQQQIALLKGIQQKYAAQKVAEQEYKVQIYKSKNALSDFQIKAAKSGIVTDFTAKIGQSISASQELGKILDTNNTIVEAEVDELFANDVQNGQKVVIFPVGRKDTLALGEVYYLSPILSNKSILYESANEGDDRRVRKVKIKITNNKNLTINAKVDCTIRIK